jgi:hypothetical protein
MPVAAVGASHDRFSTHGGHVSQAGLLGGLLLGSIVAGFGVGFRTYWIWGRPKKALEVELLAARANEAAAQENEAMTRAAAEQDLAEYEQKLTAMREEYEQKLAAHDHEQERGHEKRSLRSTRRMITEPVRAVAKTATLTAHQICGSRLQSC